MAGAESAIVSAKMPIPKLHPMKFSSDSTKNCSRKARVLCSYLYLYDNTRHGLLELHRAFSSAYTRNPLLTFRELIHDAGSCSCVNKLSLCGFTATPSTERPGSYNVRHEGFVGDPDVHSTATSPILQHDGGPNGTNTPLIPTATSIMATASLFTQLTLPTLPATSLGPTLSHLATPQPGY